MQSLLGMLLGCVCISLLVLIRQVTPGAKAAAVIWGLKVAVAVLFPPAIIVFISAYGMWKSKKWGWWLGLLSDLALSGLFVYSLVDDGWKNLDWSVLLLMAASMAPLPLLLLSRVRRFYSGVGRASMVSR